MLNDALCSFMILYDALWCLMMLNDAWWCSMMLDDPWWCLMILKGYTWCCQTPSCWPKNQVDSVCGGIEPGPGVVNVGRGLYSLKFGPVWLQCTCSGFLGLGASLKVPKSSLFVKKKAVNKRVKIKKSIESQLIIDLWNHGIFIVQANFFLKK